MANTLPSTAHHEIALSVSPDHRRRWLLPILAAVPAYLFSVWLLGIYTESDQEFYDRFYYAVMFSDQFYWKELQYINLGSAEPLYRYVIGFAASAELDRIAYLSVWNALLVSVVCYSLSRYRVSVLFWLFALTNNYLLVLIGPAERLKFAYIFIVLAFCVNDPRFKSAVASISIFFHTQAIAQLVASGVGYLIDNHRIIFKNRARVFAIVLFGLPAAAFVGYLFVMAVGNVAVDKADKYASEADGIVEMLQWAVILIGGLVVFDKRIKFFLSMLPLGALSLLYGGRINIAIFALFCAAAMVERKTSHPIILAIMAYMSFKSIGFIQNTLAYGQAF